jgi:hypothetical protein
LCKEFWRWRTACAKFTVPVFALCGKKNWLAVMRPEARPMTEIFWCPVQKIDSVMVHCWLCPGGGIGRRARFRSVYRKMWRFEFSPGHQIHPASKCWRNEGHCQPSGLFAFQALFQHLLQPHPQCSDRHRHQIVALRADDPRLGKFTDLQRLADLLGWQQFHDTVNLGRVRVAASHAAFFPHARR